MQNANPAVIGAGISGLAAGWTLKRAGLPVTVYEASGRVGGAIETVRLERSEGRWLLEEGPNTVRLADEVFENLIRDLGLEAEQLVPGPEVSRRYVVRGGRLHMLPMSPTSLLKSSLLSFYSKRRILGELRRKTPDLGEFPSVAALLAHRFSPEVVDYLVDPFIAGVWAGDPRKLSAAHALPAFHRMLAEHGSLLKGQMAAARARKAAGKPGAPPIVTFREGMCRLPERLAEEIGPEMRLNTGVERISPLPDGGWELRLAGDETMRHSHLIHTLPADGLLPMLQGTDLEKDLRPLAALPHPPVTMLSLGFRKTDIAHKLDGFGLLVPGAEPFKILGCIFASSIFPDRAPEGHALLVVFLGGTRKPDLTTLPLEEQVRIATSDLHKLLGIKGQPVLQRAKTWTRAIPQYDLAHAERLAAIAAAQAAHPTLRLAGNYHGGIGVPDRVKAGLEAAAGLLTR